MTLQTALLFPGQGAQKPFMGKDLYDQFSTYRETLVEASDILHEDVSTVIFNDNADQLNKTEWSQVAIFVSSIATYKTLQELLSLPIPYVSAGLSLGEYSAFCAANYLPFKESLELVRQRGLSMSKACEETKGKMVALIGSDEAGARQMIEDLNLNDKVWVANLNSPGQVVVSGYADSIDIVIAKHKEYNIRKAIALNVHGAFHSGLMRPAQDLMSHLIGQTKFEITTTKLIQNYSASIPSSVNELQSNLIEQISGTTRWAQSMELLSKEPIQLILDIGPAQVASIIKRIPLPAPVISISSVDGIKKLEDYLNNVSSDKPMEIV